jgi:NCAIR mutase (PurE)-related protein
MGRLAHLPYEDLEFAKVDHHRAIRQGVPEVVLAEGKSPDQVRDIGAVVLERSERLLITRATPAVYTAVHQAIADASYDEAARTIVVDRRGAVPRLPGVLVVSAGTADLPVASEAAATAEFMDCGVRRSFDVGVAGLHRLAGIMPALGDARVIVAVAGMDGALPSVLGGLVDIPVVAVPTSVGYGASFEGLAALLAMLNSCAPGIGVVNIDNGFGAGYLAALINKLPSPS